MKVEEWHYQKYLIALWVWNVRLRKNIVGITKVILLWSIQCDMSWEPVVPAEIAKNRWKTLAENILCDRDLFITFSSLLRV